MDKNEKLNIIDRTTNRVKNLTLKVVNSLSTEGLQYGDMNYCDKIINEIKYTKNIIDNLDNLKENI